MSLLLLSILYMVSLGLVCPSATFAAGSAVGSGLTVGGDGGSANVVDLFGDIVATMTSVAGNDTQYKTTGATPATATVISVYGDSVGRTGPDSFIQTPDTVWYDVTVTNAGNSTDSMVLSVPVVAYRISGLPATDSVNVTVWNASATTQISSVTLPPDSTSVFKVAVYVKITAPRNDTLDVTIKAVARGGLGGDTDGYTGFDGVAYCGDGDDSVILPVGVRNRAPVAYAGVDTSTAPGETMSLSGSGSTDLDGDTLAYSWTQDTGAAVSFSPSGNVVNPTFVSDTAYTGVYVLRPTVTDAYGDTGVDTIQVSAGNVPPVASAGPDTSVPNNSLLLLNAGASSDLNGDPMQYKWVKTVGPVCTIQNDTLVVADISMTNKGVYQFMLSVNDASDTGYDTVQVTVQNTPPIARMDGTETWALNNDTFFLVGASSTDSDAGDTLTYAWTKLTGPAATIVNPASDTASVYMTLKGEYVFQLIVSDGTDSAVDTKQVTVQNTAPLAHAGADSTVTYQDTVVLSAGLSSDSDAGDTLIYAWSQTSGPGVSLTPGLTVVNPQFVADTIGTFVFQVLVGDGADTASDTVQIDALNTPPVSNSGVDTLIAAGETVVLSGVASSDPNGQVLTYQWAQVGGPARTLTPDANAVSPSFVADTVYIGSYTFTLVVNDGYDSSQPDTVVVTAGNVPPVADAGPDTGAVVHPDTFTLNGSASSDLNGDTLTYIWSFVSGPMTPTLVPGGNVVSPQFFAAVTGQYVFQLIVSDGVDSSAADTVLLTATNTPPVPNAGLDTTVTSGFALQLSGALSSDIDGDTISFLWAQTAGAGVTLMPNATSTAPICTPTLSGSYSFVLCVTDGIDTAYDTVDVTVVAGAGIRVSFPGDTHMLADSITGNVTIRVLIQDMSGNPTEGETVTFTQLHPTTSLLSTEQTDTSGEASYTFAPGTTSSFYKIEAQVVSTGAQQNFYAYSDQLTIPPQADSAPGSGWRMWSPNKTPEAPATVQNIMQDAPSTLGTGVPAYVYEWVANAADNGSFTKYSTPANIVRGRAYWVKDHEGGLLTTPGVSDTAVTVYDTLVGRGWHQIGSGQHYFVDWASGVEFADAADDTQCFYPPISAGSMGLIKNAIYWRDDNIGNYWWGPDSAGPNNLSPVLMKPMAGFWMWVETDAVVMKVMPKPAYPDSAAAQIYNQAPKYLSAQYQKKGIAGNDANWAVQLVAQSGAMMDAQNYVGVQPTAVSASRATLYEPPAVASGYLTLGLRDVDVSGSPLSAAAYTAPITTAKTWDVDVYSDLNRPVTITWDNVTSIPEKYEVYLITPGGRVDMRKAGTYQVPPVSGKQTLKMVVGLAEYLAGYLAAPLAREEAFAYPNPGPDPATGIVHFKHNVTAGVVSVRIFDVGGRIVKELSGATSPIDWDTTNRNGQKVGSGVYIYIMEADGNKLVDKLAIVR